MDLSAAHGAFDAASGRQRRVVILGGGASGVLMALHLLRASQGVTVCLVEKSDMLGCGVAYGTRDPAHLLNTRVANMSAFVDDQAHFLDWLRATVDPTCCPWSFVSREVYGRYLAETLAQAPGRDRLTCLQAEAVRVEPLAQGTRVHLADGRTVTADITVLATGHALPAADPDAALSLPWGDGAPPERMADVLIVGTGLTMVDQVLSLLDAGHGGRIEAVSRRRLLPQPHADAAPLGIAAADLPLGRPVSALMRWLRDRVATAEAEGGDWRSVVDGLRPHVQALWQAMGTPERARFLRHACGWWEVHRHRMPPSSAQRLAVAQREGRLILRRAAFLGAERGEGGRITARLRLPDRTEEARVVHRVIDCRGIRRDPAQNAGPVIRHLIADGLACVDPLRLGIDVDARARVLRPDGTPHATIFALGPVSRAAFWEITAIPDIRLQAARLSAQLVEPESQSA